MGSKNLLTETSVLDSQNWHFLQRDSRGGWYSTTFTLLQWKNSQERLSLSESVRSPECAFTENVCRSFPDIVATKSIMSWRVRRIILFLKITQNMIFKSNLYEWKSFILAQKYQIAFGFYTLQMSTQYPWVEKGLFFNNKISRLWHSPTLTYLQMIKYSFLNTFKTLTLSLACSILTLCVYNTSRGGCCKKTPRWIYKSFSIIYHPC